VLNSLSVSSQLLTFATLLLSVVNFFVMKHISGYQLLGLRWLVSLPGCSLSVLSRPEPFVPLLSQSNLFWLGFICSIAVWFVCFVVNVLGPFFQKVAVSGTSCLLETVNLICFAKSHRESKHRTEVAVLNSLKDGVHFDLVPDNDDEKVDENVTRQDDNPATASVALPPPLAPEDEIY
jgi:hypothetical protein